MNRVLRRFTQILAVVLAAFFLAAGPAQALGSLPPPPIPTGRDCLNPPMPANPASGIPHYIDAGPKTPIAGDPFTAGSKATMYDRYSYAGFVLGTFDTPNKLDICQPFTIDADQRFANLQMDISLTMVSVTTQLTRLVTTGTLGSLWDPLQERLTSTLGGKLFISMSGAALAGAALWVFWQRGRRGEVAKIAAWAGKSLTIVGVAVACTFYAVGVGGAVDRGIGIAVQSASELSTAGDREPADVVGSILIDKVIYPTWQRQMFGDNTAARDKYQARLWKAGTFTREEQAALDANPGGAQAVIDDRREQYKAVMLEIENEYPATYPQTAGMNTRAQLGESTAGAVSVFSASWFLFACLVLLVWASVIARIGIGIFPAIAIPAVFPRLHGMAYDLGMTIVRAAWQAVVAAFAVFVYLVAALAPIMGSEFNPFLKVVMILFVSVAMFKLMKKLKVMPGSVTKKFGDVFNRKSNSKTEKNENSKTSTSPIDDLGNLPSAGGPGGKPGMPGAGGGSVATPREVKQTARPVSVGIGAPAVDRGDLGDLKSATAATSPGAAGAAGRAAPGRRGVLTPAMAGSRNAVATAGKKHALAAGASTAAKATPHGRALVVGTAVAKVATARRGMHQTTTARNVRPPVTKLGGVNPQTGPIFRPGNASAPATVISGQVIKRGHHTPVNPIKTTGPAAPKAPAPIKRT